DLVGAAAALDRETGRPDAGRYQDLGRRAAVRPVVQRKDRAVERIGDRIAGNVCRVRSRDGLEGSRYWGPASVKETATAAATGVQIEGSCSGGCLSVVLGCHVVGITGASGDAAVLADGQGGAEPLRFAGELRAGVEDCIATRGIERAGALGGRIVGM